ncbi:MAG: TolC family outer membrane protein [Alphaproteobacteria bacterium]|nr:TolC family outer membrane protein [Alphaproteobacteria bacterium]
MRFIRHGAIFAAFAVAWAGPALAAAKHHPKPARLAQADKPDNSTPPAAAVPGMPPQAAPETPSMTLNDALGIAYETNPELAAAQAGLRASDEDVAKANGAWRPTFAIDASYGVEKYYFPVAINGGGVVTGPHPVGVPPALQQPVPPAGTGVTIVNGSITDHPLNGAATLTQPIFRSGRTIAEISRAKALVRSGRAQLTATEQTVLLDTVTAYMNVVRDGAIVKLKEHNVAVLRRQRDSTQLEFKAGSLTRTDVAQSEARLATAQSDLTTARGQLATSRADFLKTIGRPAETLESDPALPRMPEDQDALLGMALKQSPLLLTAQFNERAANYAVDDAWGAMGPTLQLQGQYLYSQSALNSVQGFGADGGSPQATAQHGLSAIAQLHVPIYQAGVEEASIRQARELHTQSKLNVAVADRQVRDAVDATWAGYQSALGTIESNDATAKADAIAFEGVSKEQQVGGRTVLDVLNAEQELLNAQVALVTSQRNAVVAAYTALAAGGGLTAKGLGLKVKLYDPLVHYDNDAAAWIGFGGGSE